MDLKTLKETLGGLPTRAGKARLEWLPKRDPRLLSDEPGIYLDDSVIVIPTDRVLSFHPLRNGRQFVLKQRERIYAVPTYYFGGTDEAPFLVELHPAVGKLVRKGEKKFFSALKPDGVKQLEALLKVKAIRQGDWFAVPLMCSWEIVQAATSSSKIGTIRAPELGIPLGGSSHWLRYPRFIELPDRPSNRHPRLAWFDAVLIGEGILTAPDHTDRVLKGPHAFFQTAGLMQPSDDD